MYFEKWLQNIRFYMHTKPWKWRHATLSTGWQRLIGCLKLQVFFHKRATNHRALLQKMTTKDKAPCESSPPCTPWHTYVHVNITYVWMCKHNLENGAVTLQAIDATRTHMYMQYPCVSICIKTWKMAWRRLEYSAAAFLSSFASVRSDVMSSSRRASASALRLPTTAGKKQKKVAYLLRSIIIKLTFEISRARHGARLCLGLRPPPLLIAPKSTKKISSIYSEITMELTFEKSQTREVVPPPLPCGSLPLRKGKKCCCHASFENWFATKRARSQNWSPYSIDCANTLLTRFRF